MGGPHVASALRPPHKARPATAELKPATLDLSFGAQDGARPGSATAKPPSRPLRPSGARRPATAGPALGGGGAYGINSTNVPPPRRAFESPGTQKDTFASKVPLKWSVGAVAGPATSAYADAFGGKVGRARPSSALLSSAPIRYREFTCPFGAVNVHTAIAPVTEAVPVPEGFLTGRAGGQAFPLAPGHTAYRGDFAARNQVGAK
jgi:hypothetical protein